MVALSNVEVAGRLEQLAGLLELSGESPFRANAYLRAAESIRALPEPLADVARRGRLRELPGVGVGIAQALTELLETGRLTPLDALAERYPLTLLDLLAIPGVGAKTAARLYHELGIADLPALEAAAVAGRLRDVKGMGARLERTVIEGIEALKRRTGRTLLGVALPAGRWLVEAIGRTLPDAAVSLAGSVRRREETVGDIDVVVGHTDPARARVAVAGLPAVARTVAGGSHHLRVALQSGLEADVFIADPARFGSVLVRATGNADHLARLGALPESATEDSVYAAVGLPWIPPELRQGRLEFERAAEIPGLIDVADIRGEFHCHTTWSDGAASIAEMAAAAAARGYAALAITDHSQALGVAGGLTPERLRLQREEIAAANRPQRIRVLQGAEVEVGRDGRLDYTDDILAGLDVVVASLHTGLRQARGVLTDRLVNVLRNPNVDIIAHPSGRLIERREGGDFDWDRVFAVAAETGTALEINADPLRLDLDPTLARRAVEAGCLLTINCDAHRPDGFALIEYGVAVARRAWVLPDLVINCWTPDRLRAWLDRGFS